MPTIQNNKEPPDPYPKYAPGEFVEEEGIYKEGPDG